MPLIFQSASGLWNEPALGARDALNPDAMECGDNCVLARKAALPGLEEESASLRSREGARSVGPGYSSRQYAESFAQWGTPVELPRSGGWIIRRAIGRSTWDDAMGCYPLFRCQNWSELAADIQDLPSGLVSLSMVLDPFAPYTAEDLRRCFPELVLPFKRHFLVDLKAHPRDFVCSHHRRNARKAFKHLAIERCDRPAELAGAWIELYQQLVDRRGIKGIPAFSKESLARQLMVPGAVVFRAGYEGRTVAMNLWYVHGHVGYYHLGAASELGYQLRASFGLFWMALEHFRTRLEWLDLGGSAGLQDGSEEQGLGRFKAGWSTGTRFAYFCGKILDPAKYHEIVKVQGIGPTRYFPAYREGEFG